jgi:hypothetical protein
MKYFIELPEVWITEFLENDPDCSGYWISSLTQSWQKGYADNCTLVWTNYVDVVRRLRLHTDKQIIVDVDMLFNEPSIAATIAKELYAVGCNMIVVESKRFPKVNSLTPDAMVLSTPDEFCRLINKVKTTVPELEVIARNEYLATTKSIETTYNISKRAVRAGADGVVVHWGADADTSLLKETLLRLKNDGIKTGIIPTKYLDQVVKGDFDDKADFSILGNICSSYIRHIFSHQSVKTLLESPCMFKPILDRVGSHEPKGHKTLVVLGAKPDTHGNVLLENIDYINKFTAQLDNYYNVVFVLDAQSKINIKESDKIHIAQIEDSIGEVDSLTSAREYINTEYVTVVYADIEDKIFHYLSNMGVTFVGDNFAGVLSVKTDILFSMLQTTDPSMSIFEMTSSNNIQVTVEK